MPEQISIDEAIRAYEAELTSPATARKTKREYLTDVRQLGDYLAVLGVRTVQAVQRTHIESFLVSLERLGLIGSTRRRKLFAVMSFFQFLAQAGLRTGDPAADVVPPPLFWHLPRYLSEREYERLRLAVRHEPRDAAIIELLLQTGMRLSEVAPLRLTDVELSDRRQTAVGGPATGHVRIWRGRRCRLVTLNAKACAALHGYLLVRPTDAEDDRLFQGKFHPGIGPRSVESIVAKYLRDAGIRGASVHTLRHTFAVHTLK